MKNWNILFFLKYTLIYESSCLSLLPYVLKSISVLSFIMSIDSWINCSHPVTLLERKTASAYLELWNWMSTKGEWFNNRRGMDIVCLTSIGTSNQFDVSPLFLVCDMKLQVGGSSVMKSDVSLDINF